MKIADLSSKGVHDRMSSAGLAMAIPPITVRLRSPLLFFAEQIRALYADYDVLDVDRFADADIRLLPVPGVRQWLRRQVQFIVDGVAPFEPFPLDHALPMFEWGLNWVFCHRMHQFLLLHSAVVERGGRALLLPAWPGCGKSTLAASLSCRGWRFLSDEFGVVSFDGAKVLPFARPVALKNESIGVMRAFDDASFIGPVFPKTRKGDVAHFRVPSASVSKADQAADIAVIVFPDFQSGAAVEILPLARATAFLKLAGNAFNYEVVGERGFQAIASIMQRCPSVILRYGDLDAAHAAIDHIMQSAAGA